MTNTVVSKKIQAYTDKFGNQCFNMLFSVEALKAIATEKGNVALSVRPTNPEKLTDEHIAKYGTHHAVVTNYQIRQIKTDKTEETKKVTTK
jgi:uncharacterized protein (DUF927 family)